MTAQQRIGKNRRFLNRSGGVSSISVFVLSGVAVVAASAWFFWGGSGETSEDVPLFTSVVRGSYEHIVLEQGEIESSNNVEVRCLVKNRTGGDSPSTTILDVIEEGTTVEEGQWLVSFDSTTLENEMATQKIATQSAETLTIQAKALYDTAVISKTEYLMGTYEQEKKTHQNAIFVAEEALKKAELSYDSVKRSVARGLVSELQLEGERYRVDAAKKDLELANKTLEVLENYTKEKMVTQMESDIRATRKTWENEQANHAEEVKKLEKLQAQLKNCKVFAPQAGQVVYANVNSRRSDSEFVVELGAGVRERQVIIRLPDPTKMQVSTNISETRISLVKEGMPTSISIEAIPGEVYQGIVTSVGRYAEPGNWWGSSGKEYKALVKIIDPPPQIRTGLTAEVRIEIENRDGILQVPVQAVLERDGDTYCLVKNDDEYETKRIKIKSTNDIMIALDETPGGGLSENDQIVLNPRQHRDKFDFSGFFLDTRKATMVASGTSTNGEAAKEKPSESMTASESTEEEETTGQDVSKLASPLEKTAGSNEKPAT